MKVVKIVEEDVSEKVDTSYILEQLRHLDRVGITFICIRDEQEEDDWVDEAGRHIVICLPYKEVKQLADARPLMLARAREQLGA